MSRFLESLVAVVGDQNVITGSALTSYTTDWTGRFHGAAQAAIRPADTSEVSQILKLCHENKVLVVPQGGNTGLVGGSVPVGAPRANTEELDPIVLSMTRLKRVEPVDSINRSVTVGAGLTIAELREHVHAGGFEYGVDFAARDSATVGGSVATDAGGVRVVKWGTTRSQVLGLELVRADGQVIDALGAVQKDGAGYDLSTAIIGSEGTLAVITAARLRVQTPMKEPHTVLIGCPSWSSVNELLQFVRESGVGVSATEVFDQATLQIVAEVNSLPKPLVRDWPVLLLVETDEALEWPDDLDAAVALDSSDRKRIWKYREEASVAISTLPNVHKMDVSLPIESIEAFTSALQTEFQDQTEVAKVIVFGHLSEGNLHVEVAGPTFDDSSSDELVYRLAARFGGSIASEHGVGRVKPHLLSMVRDPAYLEMLRRTKSAWDPDWLLNRGVLVTQS